MNTHTQIDQIASLNGPVHLAIGVFDGVHLGHQEVIRHAQRAAEKSGGVAIVATFDPHPMRVLRPTESPRLLTSTRHKEIILSRLGIQNLLEIPFTPEFSQLTAQQFIGRLAQHSHPLASISVGADWGFGKGRTGNVATLKELGQQLCFEVHGVPRVCLDGEPISSTRIRSAVEAGDFPQANHLLGRDYAVLGNVVAGRKLGRKIGFPTANLSTQAEQLPPVGVYAVTASLGAEFLPAVANLGYRPTISQDHPERILEVHLLDFDQDIYGREVEVKFVQRLRDEMRLPDLEALKAQIAKDCLNARRALDLDLNDDAELIVL